LTTSSSGHLLSSTAHEVLSLGSIVARVLLHALKTLACSFASNVFDLIGLSRDDSGGMFQLSVNDVLVLKINQRSQIDDARAEEGKSPEWHDLDQIVGDESREECLERKVC
jgi:hypothetical protein